MLEMSDYLVDAVTNNSGAFFFVESVNKNLPNSNFTRYGFHWRKAIYGKKSRNGWCQ